MEDAVNQTATAAQSLGIPTVFYLTMILYAISACTHMGIFWGARPWLARMAKLSLLAAFIVHFLEIGWRGIHELHPATSVREALGFLSWLMVGGYLLASIRQRLGVLGAFVAPAALVVLAAARLSPSGEALVGLSALGRIHISLATLGVALFALATGLAVVYLFAERNLKRKRFDGILFRRGLALETLDLMAHRLVVIAFPIFTLAIMLGVVWVSQRASGFGRPEYSLALVTWISFAALIVTRTTHGWRGRRTAWMTIVGFVAAVMVFAIYLLRHSL